MTLPILPRKESRNDDQFITAVIQSSRSQHVKSITRDHPKLRQVVFHSNEYQSDDFRNKFLNVLEYKYAAAIQQRGQENALPCECCRDNDNRPFTTCVFIREEQSGKCANCIFLRQICTQTKTGHQQRQDGSLRRAHNPKKAPISFARPTIIKRVGYHVISPDHESLNPGTNSYRVLGNLVLPPPPLGKHRHLAGKYKNELDKLHRRDMSKLPDRPIAELSSSFLDFKRREAAAWESYEISHPLEDIPGYLTDPRYLVKPSGSLESPLAHRLNQPSFTTTQEYDGETADPTNGCIAMVMGNAYTPGTFLFNQFPRRSYQSEATEGGEFPDDVQECHVKFTADIADSIYAKVEIFYGVKVEKYTRKSQTFAVLPLWGEFDSIEIRLMYEKDYGNPDKDYMFRRAVLTCKHPQHLMMPGNPKSLGAQQDKITKAAWLMAEGKGHHIPIVPNYYSEEKWKQRAPPKPEGVALGRSAKPVPVIFAGEDTRSWRDFFSKHPHSDNDLRDLIQPALEALKSASPHEAWAYPEDIPKPVLDWLRGQKQILFPNQQPSNMHEIHERISNILSRANLLQQPTPADLISSLAMILNHQSQIIGNRRADTHSLWYSGFDGTVLALRCSECEENQIRSDDRPRWSVSSPGTYLCREWNCSKCGKKARMMPVDEDITFSKNDKHELHSTPGPARSTWAQNSSGRR